MKAVRFAARSVGTLALGALLLAPPAAAQDTMTKEDGLTEYQIVEVDPDGWQVTARDGTGRTIQFELQPAQLFGERFMADAAGRKPGRRFSIQGQGDLQLEVTLDGAPSTGPSRRLRGGSGGELGGTAYEVVSASPSGIVSAREASGSGSIQFRIDPRAFNGYRFMTDNRELGEGATITLVAPNDAPVDGCAVLLNSTGS